LRFLFLARRGPAAPDAPALVADDQVRLTSDGARILANAPESISGQMEVRGVGIVGTRPVVDAELVVVVDLVAPSEVERLPDPAQAVTILGVKLPLLRLAAFEGSTPMKLALAIARAGRG
jgi:serine kinase of HPr protein (carbohydrate metabolism regulator)